MKWIDISRTLRGGMPVWPGDTPFSFNLEWTKEQSGSVNVGKVVFSTHAGTHVDAPYHFSEAGKKVHELEPDIFVGKARVLHLPGYESIGAEELAAHDLTGVERLLIRTDSWEDPDRFPDSFCCLRPDAAPLLAEKGVKLLGIDVPSVDPIDSKELPAHHALCLSGIHILESVDLSRADAGDYELIALPLKLEGADGSPVRAILKKTA
ncbi:MULTISPECIES: arylformamidase [Thermoactinomyces]|jgi:arylformamidase|uniref:Kynurenine formamidase n=1 Tax=Thermoactinomyces daqus TaxID=1329516 RepID=A0A7W2AH95_9BACL|nr:MULTISPECIES: arylformamidase [Thermoactinomyces]MBA4541618.1 arylformamidase [Thermoactinomyces daqus]MBH8597614.1 arylformamidase [Thermoactinomyces sp. CICC 10523]MBH8603955.1 arylformamidase [Thermoactinomyces sp. CICC 10522]MBH8606511.1 arylformamidase [Thermoactinomyces sp. CICC 10521]